ncbi:peroxiredoxin [Scopulibacillus daqui]|uniref:Peroxiredoxin n=1 Tax=Scopulibacillus daqui TaxID=1469162 RepID=A0ABS2Q180_9BACL|nr:peroxiredoxin family protein [Scopulibacillus daqui]MBM7646053.1 peroxiredoxin [Scopulibacillus daqui]
MPRLKIGEKAPEFNLISTDGAFFSFKDHLKEHKSWHMIVFFRGEWCPAERDFLSALQADIDKFKALDTHIIAISSDEIDRLKELVENQSLAFPVLSDNERRAAKGYDIFVHGEDAPYADHAEHIEPAIFIVDDHGNLLFQQLQSGPFGRPTPMNLRKTIKYIRENLR